MNVNRCKLCPVGFRCEPTSLTGKMFENSFDFACLVNIVQRFQFWFHMKLYDAKVNVNGKYQTINMNANFILHLNTNIRISCHWLTMRNHSNSIYCLHKWFLSAHEKWNLILWFAHSFEYDVCALDNTLSTQPNLSFEL